MARDKSQDPVVISAKTLPTITMALYEVNPNSDPDRIFIDTTRKTYKQIPERIFLLDAEFEYNSKKEMAHYKELEGRGWMIKYHQVESPVKESK